MGPRTQNIGVLFEFFTDRGFKTSWHKATPRTNVADFLRRQHLADNNLLLSPYRYSLYRIHSNRDEAHF